MSRSRAFVLAAISAGLVGVAVAGADLQSRAVATACHRYRDPGPGDQEGDTRSLDPLEPLVMASAAFSILFLARPLYDLIRGDVSFLDFNTDASYDMALASAAVAIVAFQLGYATARVSQVIRGGNEALYRFWPGRSNYVLVGFAVVLTAVAAVAALVNAILAGGAESLLQDRTAVATGATNVPAIAGAVSAAVPAVLLLWCIDGPWKRVARAMSVVPMAVLGVAAIPKGDRRLLLPLAVAGGAYYYLRRGRRPSWFQVAALVAATMFLVITPLREARTGQVGIGEAFVQGLQNPGAAIEGLLISQDTSQLSVLAVMISEVGDGRPIPWQWGMSTLTETVLQPIPRQVWEDKPSPIGTQFIEYNWGMAGGRCVSQCPTLSDSRHLLL